MIEGLTKAHRKTLDLGAKRLKEIHRDCGVILGQYAALGEYKDATVVAFNEAMLTARSAIEIALPGVNGASAADASGDMED